ncbi:MAG: hypothetical protein ACTSU5_02430 [Promethearchaeota archaeon]
MELKYIGTVANRDLDLMDALKAYFRKLDVETVEIDPNATRNKIVLDKKTVKVIMPKLLTAKSNSKLFKKLRKTKLHFINSLKAVNICQSRRRTFAHLKKKAPWIKTPKVFKSVKGIKKAFKAGKSVWVRRDDHNIPKDERVIGIAGSLSELYALVKYYDPRELFFQEYLGEKDLLLKAYVIGDRVFCLKKKGYQDGLERDDDLLTETRYEPKRSLREIILGVGSAFKMAVYGVDIIYEDGVPVVVDINDFPSFRGVDEAVETICQYIRDRYLSK